MIQAMILSVVIPCRNEAEHIARCLESVTGEIVSAHIPAEVIVVDSASEDLTVEIARRYPVTILQLPGTWPLSPAAGRYIGCVHSGGDYIFIIDADMELLPGFLAAGLKFLAEHPRVAGVAGMGTECYPDGGRREDLYRRRHREAPVEFLGGAALFRRDALLEAGNFNPYLKAEEEAELALRLARCNYRLYSLPQDMTRHYSVGGLEDFERRLRSGLFRGIGQMLRLSWTQKTLTWQVVRRFPWLMAYGAVLSAVLTAAACAVFFRQPMIWWGACIAVTGGWAFVCVGKRGIVEGTLSVYKWLRLNRSIVRGLCDVTPDPRTYPTDAVVLRKGELLG